MKPIDTHAYEVVRRRRWVGWVLRCGSLVAQGGDRPLVFDSLQAAIDAASDWTLAGAHLGADWRPSRVNTETLDKLREQARKR